MPSSLNEMSNRQRVKRPITLSSHWLLNQPLYFHLLSNKNKYGKYIANIQTVFRRKIHQYSDMQKFIFNQDDIYSNKNSDWKSRNPGKIRNKGANI